MTTIQKIIMAAAASVIALSGLAQTGAPAAAPQPLATATDSVAAVLAGDWAEAIGPAIARQMNELRSHGVEINQSAFYNLLGSYLRGAAPMPRADRQAYVARRLGPTKARTTAVDSAYAAGQEEWLRRKAATQGVAVMPDGLIFEVIKEGEGACPTTSDIVEVNYTGRLSDGTVFDSTDGKPVQFPAGRLIRGFTEGLTMMKPGGTYRLYIPSQLGYGERGAGGKIPGGAALDFTVELIKIVDKPESK